MNKEKRKRAGYIILGIFLLFIAISFYNHSQPAVLNDGLPGSITYSFAFPSSPLSSIPQLYSIGISGINASNITYVGTNLSVSVNLAIPSQYFTTAWNPNITTMVHTACASFIYSNNTKNYIFESPIVNMSSSPYTYSFNYKISNPGYYAIGGVCESENTTWNPTTHTWSNWTAPKPVVLQVQPIDAIVSSQPPKAQAISINNILSDIITAIQNFISSILKMLGV